MKLDRIKDTFNDSNLPECADCGKSPIGVIRDTAVCLSCNYAWKITPSAEDPSWTPVTKYFASAMAGNPGANHYRADAERQGSVFMSAVHARATFVAYETVSLVSSMVGREEDKSLEDYLGGRTMRVGADLRPKKAPKIVAICGDDKLVSGKVPEDEIYDESDLGRVCSWAESRSDVEFLWDIEIRGYPDAGIHVIARNYGMPPVDFRWSGPEAPGRIRVGGSNKAPGSSVPECIPQPILWDAVPFTAADGKPGFSPRYVSVLVTEAALLTSAVSENMETGEVISAVLRKRHDGWGPAERLESERGSAESCVEELKARTASAKRRGNKAISWEKEWGILESDPFGSIWDIRKAPIWTNRKIHTLIG